MSLSVRESCRVAYTLNVEVIKSRSDRHLTQHYRSELKVTGRYLELKISLNFNGICISFLLTLTFQITEGLLIQC